MATKKSAKPEYDPVEAYPPRSYEDARDPSAFPEMTPPAGPDVPEGYSPPDPDIQPVPPEERLAATGEEGHPK